MKKKRKLLFVFFVTAAFIVCTAGSAFADFTVGSGETFTLSAGETLTVDGNLTIESTGTLDVSAANTNIIVSGNWTNSGIFTSGTSSTVTLVDNTVTSIITGDTAFYNLTCETASKQLTFAAASTQTISNTLTLNGQAIGTEIQLRSSVSGTRWTLDVSGAAQTVEYVDVKDSNASSHNIMAEHSINTGNNDDTESSPFWVFSDSIYITSPQDGCTIGQEPTIMGYTTSASAAFTIQGTSGSATIVVASGTSDASGNFRVVVDSATPLDEGANVLRPYVGVNAGSAVNVTVVAAPTSSQVPEVGNLSDGTIITTNPFIISGNALPNTEVKVQAVNEDSDLVTSVGTTTSDAIGAYSISCDAVAYELAVGSNELTITTYDAGGDPITTSVPVTISFTDPFGVVFDSVSNNPIEDAVVTLYYDNDSGAGRSWVKAVSGTHIAPGDLNPQTTGADGFYSFNCIDGDFYIDIAASGYDYPTDKVDAELPSARTIITPGSRGNPFTVAGVVIEMDHPMDATGALLKIEKDANKKEVAIGDIVTYTVEIQNISEGNVTDVYLEDKIPPGFKYISGKCILDNQSIADPSGNRPLTFNIGTITSGQTRILKYQLVVGAGVSFGNYENRAHAKYSNGAVISNNATETVKVTPDPLFDLGTIIGKVFYDRNENGIQEEALDELGVPNIQIVTEEGVIIATDKDGKYHLAGIIPGRHLLRLDERTLPKGAYLTTDKVVIVDITSGIFAKVNFGVKLPEGVDTQEDLFTITRDKGAVRKVLNVSLFNEDLVIEDGRLEEKAEFRIFTNYQLFINAWELEISDKDTKRVVKLFRGSKDNIFESIFWDGKDKDGESIRADRNYVYRLRVIGTGNKSDVTDEKRLDVRGGKRKDRKETLDVKIGYRQWLQRESRINALKQQAISVAGEVVKIRNIQSAIDKIRILRSGNFQTEIPVVISDGLTAKDLFKGQDKGIEKEIEIILPNGEYTIEGKHIKVGDDYLFFVGMGDAKIGYTFNRGDIEPVQHEDKFNKGFWSEGKVAYYLKGKIKGKYLVTSSLDSDRNKKELFNSLDADKYYPVYGDASSINYDATNTQGMLYLLVEWDKSSALWGNYNTAFTETEFAQFSRTLYGGKVYLESVSTTKFGQPQTKLIAFRARAQQKAAHNEFIGTGGSLYYLKHKDVVDGSDNVRIEVRDRITGLVLASQEMKEGVDYEIDYANARIIFWQPVSVISESSSIISTHLLNGNPVYVVADYEYEVKDKHDDGTVGVRASKSLGDYLNIGGTYVKEEKQMENYQLKGADVSARLGDNIKVNAEYAMSKSEAMGSFISTDGGLSFTELPTAQYAKGKAYGVNADAQFFDNKLGLSGYYKWIDNNFSTSVTSSQQGKELVGFSAVYDPTSKTRLSLSHDIQKLINDGNLQTALQVGATKTETTSVQATHDVVTDKLKLTAEMRHQQVSESKEAFESETNTEQDIVALKADYKLTDKIDVSLQQQATIKGGPDYQTTAGITTQVSKRLNVRAKEAIGTQGTATSVGATIMPVVEDENSADRQASLADKLSISADYTKTTAVSGEIGDTVSLGAGAQVDDKTEVHGAYAVTDSMSEEKVQSFTFGSKRKINNDVELTADKTFATSKNNVTKSSSYGFLRERNGRVLNGTYAKQCSESADAVSNSNIFGLSGDINDFWSAFGTFERGIVQNHDGTQDRRHAGSLGVGFVDKDKETGEVKLKASSKLELRFDDGQENVRQHLFNSAIEGKVNSTTTLFVKANISQTKNTTIDSTEAQFKELALGAAYRPIKFDWINLIAKYTYLEDDSPTSQSDMNDIEKEKAHILSSEAIMDLIDKWQLSEKFAYKMGEEKVIGFEFTKTQTWLWVNRLGYNINKDWQVSGEYRLLTQRQAEDQKHGVLVEIDRKIGEFIQIGVGYNFTDFNDDLTDLNYTSQGPFIRVTGKFYDRTPEEIESTRKKRIELNMKRWVNNLVNNELKNPDSPIVRELHNYFYLAKTAKNEGRFEASKEFYEKIIEIAKRMKAEAEEYIEERIKFEEKLELNNQKALECYKSGKLIEAKELWQNIITELNQEVK